MIYILVFIILILVGFVVIKKRKKANFEVEKELFEFLEFASSNKLGCLIVLEGGNSLDGIVNTGTVIDGVISFELLQSIFHKGSYIHDGAVVISDNKIKAAGCILPLKKGRMQKGLGTRHRAGIGVSEKFDCLVYIVSETDGKIKKYKKGVEL
jgi:diadenylate cyclase